MDRREIEAACTTLGACVQLLGGHDWDALARAIDDADTLGPVIWPAMYEDALWSGRMDTNRRIVAATREFLQTMQQVMAQAGGR